MTVIVYVDVRNDDLVAWFNDRTDDWYHSASLETLAAVLWSFANLGTLRTVCRSSSTSM